MPDTALGADCGALREPRLRLLLLAARLPMSLLMGVPSLLLLLPALGPLRGPAWAWVAGWLSADLLLRDAVRTHAEGHRLEAARLGLPGSAGGPLFAERLALARIEGSWANEARGRDPRPLHGGCLLLWLVPLAAAWAAGGLRAAGVVLSLAALLWAGTLGDLAAQSLLARLTRGERERLPGSDAGPRPWPFWRLRDHPGRRRARGELRREFRLLLRLAAGLRAGQTVLELGSGVGELWEHAPPPLRRRWLQLDADLLALVSARSRASGAAWVRADARRLPFRDASVDRILGLSFFDAVPLEHLDAILDECRRVLRPGGTLSHFEDFKDWPGRDLAASLSALLERSDPGLRVGYSRWLNRLSYPRPSRLRRALRGLELRPGEGAAGRLDLLRLACGAGREDGRDPRDPRSAFLVILREALSRSGFEPLEPPAALAARLGRVRILAARKPSSGPSSP